MSWKRDARRIAHRLGIDIVRYPLHDAIARLVRLLEYYRIDLVVDVGANDGGFATSIRDLGFSGRIISFEPVSSVFKALSHRATADSMWQTVQCAVGERESEVVINVSANNSLSSSVLPMLDEHIKAAPNSRYIGVEKVRQSSLDLLMPELGVANASRIFLKVDVQGYERNVLDGASALFSNGIIAGMQLELSLTQLYENAMTYREVINYAETLGMNLVGLDPVFCDPQSGRLLQADAVFFA